jgi:hypothetical protein
VFRGPLYPAIVPGLLFLRAFGFHPVFSTR